MLTTVLEATRKRKRLTRQDLADQANVSTMTIYSIERRGAQGSYNSLKALGDALGVRWYRLADCHD